jgi:diaminopimelate epimerase
VTTRVALAWSGEDPPGGGLRFVKAEGLGNDFLIVDARHRDLQALAAVLQPEAPKLCDRRFGVGADGLLLVGAGIGAASDATMLVINADGSRPQMCGNGLRCVALWLSRNGASTTVLVDTDAGPRHCHVIDRVTSGDVDVDMGPARHDTAVVPDRGHGRSFARVSMGNPHAIAFVEAGEDPEELARRLGPGLEHDAIFPEGTNVEFARVDDDKITLWVWERGCGITAACGTGACATVAAACAQERLHPGAPIEVVLPGGSLWITMPIDAEAGVRMRGPARLVFSGVWPA